MKGFPRRLPDTMKYSIRCCLILTSKKGSYLNVARLFSTKPSTAVEGLSDAANFLPSTSNEKKLARYKAGFPAVFEDMSKLKIYKYFAVTKFRDKPLSFYSLKNRAGIYMITNKITKKIYIGMSKNLKERFYNYLYIDRLKADKASRINKALLKYGYNNFSITILEFCDNSSRPLLQAKEDSYIKLFKPQYNIARSTYNEDIPLCGRQAYTAAFILPKMIKNLLDNCLNPQKTD